MNQNPFLMNITARDVLSEEERAIVIDLARNVMDVPADTEIVSEGDALTSSTLMLSGFSARANILKGGSRQLTAIHIAGDFVDLHSLLMPRMDHGVVALTMQDREGFARKAAPAEPGAATPDPSVLASYDR